MGQLTNQYVSQSYQGLLKMTDSTTGVTGTLQTVQTGDGTDTPLQISKTAVNITGSLTVNGAPISIATGSFATTGSNTFIGDQYITGSIYSTDIIGTGSLFLQPNQSDARYLEVYNTSPTDTHITASGGQIFLGDDQTYVKVDNYGSVERIDVVAGNELVVSSSIVNLTGSLHQSGTFYPDVIDWVNSPIVQNTGSYVLTTNLSGVTQYDSYQNVASALQPYLSTGSVPSGTVSGSAQIVELGFATTSSVNSLSQSIATTDLGQNNRLGSIESKTGSYATTGSNIFNGNQTISGSLIVTGSITALSASITYLQVTYESSSIIFSSGSNVFGDASNDTQTLWGTIKMPSGPVSITGSLTVSGSVSGSNFTGSLLGTASYATQALTSSFSTDFSRTGLIVTGAIATNQRITGSLGVSGSMGVTGSLGVLGAVSASNFTGSLFGTSSWASNAVSASQAQNSVSASQSTNANTASYILQAVSASYATNALSASQAQNAVSASQSTNTISSSYASNANSASFAQTAISSSQAANAVSASQAQNAVSSSYSNNSTSSSYSNNSTSASYANNATSASFSQNTISGSFSDFAVSSSQAQNAVSASYALLATSASVIYVQNTSANASHKVTFVDSSNTTGQLQADNDFTYNPNTNILTTTASFAQNAISASQAQNAVSASYAPGAAIPSGTVSGSQQIVDLGFATTSSVNQKLDTGSFNTYTASIDARTGSYATTGSNSFIGQQNITGSVNITGSLFEKGNLYVVNPNMTNTFDNVSSSYAGNVLFGWDGITTQATSTSSYVISGSNNILKVSQPIATNGCYNYISGSGNISLASPGIALSTGSILRPLTSNNFVNSQVTLTFISSSVAGGQPSISNNIFNTAAVINMGSSGSISATSNIINGVTSIYQTGSALANLRSTFNNNNINSTFFVQNYVSSSFTVSNNNTVGATHYIDNNWVNGFGTIGITASRNFYQGQSNFITFSGSPSSNTTRAVSDNFLGGNTVNINATVSGSNAGNSYGTIIYGYNLQANANATGVDGGSGFFGRFNDTGSLANTKDIVFAVGTGTAAATRRTGLYITSGSLVGVSGSMNVIGNTTMTGSLNVSADILFASGSNKTMGTFVLDGANPGAATVSNSLVTTSSLIFLTKQTNTNSGNGTVSVTSKGTGTFNVTSNHNGDTDTVAYLIINPA